MTAATAELADYWSAVDAGDERRAQAVARAAYDAGTPLDRVLSDLVVAAQVRVGELWATNAWTIAREHAATAVGESVVRHLATIVPDPVEGDPLLVACVEREWHAMPALVLTQTLRAWGHPVDYLGASTTRDQLVGRVVDAGPRAVLLSASLGSSLGRVRRHIEAIRGAGTPVVVGGRAFDGGGRRAKALGATAYAADPAALLSLLPDLPRHVTAAPPLRHPGATEARSIQSTTEAVTSGVAHQLDQRLDAPPDSGVDGWSAVLYGHLGHIVECLTGALLTEDASVLGDNRRWLEDVLGGRHAPAGCTEALWEAMLEELREFPEAVAVLEATR